MQRRPCLLVAPIVALVLGACAGESAQDAASLLDGGTPLDAEVKDATDAAAPDLGPEDSGILDQCDPVAQANCPHGDAGPATKCIVENSTPGGGTSCVEPSPNDVALNGACTGGDCQAGLACVRTSTSTSICEKVCNYRANVGCEGLGGEFECRTRLTGTNWGVCLRLPPTCDYLTQSPCAADHACAPYQRRSGAWEFRCRAAGPRMEGETCGSSGGGDCGRGLVCVKSPTSQVATCRKFCNGSSVDCPAPETCVGSVADPQFQYCAQ